MLNSSTPHRLALDIGNTRAHIGVVDLHRRICIASVAFPVAEIELRLSSAVKTLVAGVNIPVGTTIAVAGVVQSAAALAEQQLLRDGYTVHRLTSGASLPISLRYETPQTLGADRIANALYAATVYPGRPVICISCGTAIVIDYIADATFFGGAILPGIRLQLSSLHMGTDALPDLRDANAVQIPLLPGGSTHSCMFGGVVRGAAAAIRGIVAGYAARQPARPPVICATGGDWPVLAPLIAIECIAVPDMTLVGVACFPG